MNSPFFKLQTFLIIQSSKGYNCEFKFKKRCSLEIMSTVPLTIERTRQPILIPENP